jgi:hypothetical protein
VPAAPPGDVVEVYVTNGTKTSQGPGPGQKFLPSREAAALVRNRLASYGGPPKGLDGVPEPTSVEFR